jgi:hypothetical protein
MTYTGCGVPVFTTTGDETFCEYENDDCGWYSG